MYTVSISEWLYTLEAILLLSLIILLCITIYFICCITGTKAAKEENVIKDNDIIQRQHGLLLQQLNDDQTKLHLEIQKLKDQRDQDICALFLDLHGIKDERYKDLGRLNALQSQLNNYDGELKELWYRTTLKNHAATSEEEEDQVVPDSNRGSNGNIEEREGRQLPCCTTREERKKCKKLHMYLYHDGNYYTGTATGRIKRIVSIDYKTPPSSAAQDRPIPEIDTE